MAAKSRKSEAERGKAEAAGDPDALPCDCEESWFRSSDDVRQGYIRGIESFDVRPVTYNVIGDRAIFEGDIALGSPGEVDAVKEQVQSEATADRTGRHG